MTIGIGRREFIALLGGATFAWPLATRAQQPGRMRRVGVLIGTAESDPETKRRVEALQRGLSEAGWTSTPHYGNDADFQLFN